MQGLLRVSRTDLRAANHPTLHVFTAALEVDGAFVEELAVERTTALHTGAAYAVLSEAKRELERRGWCHVPLTQPVVCGKHEVVLAFTL